MASSPPPRSDSPCSQIPFRWPGRSLQQQIKQTLTKKIIICTLQWHKIFHSAEHPRGKKRMERNKTEAASVWSSSKQKRKDRTFCTNLVYTIKSTKASQLFDGDLNK